MKMNDLRAYNDQVERSITRTYRFALVILGVFVAVVAFAALFW
jgi:hypothetical protein